MRLHNAFFYSALFFLVGIFLSSVGVSVLGIIIFTICGAVTLLIRAFFASREKRSFFIYLAIFSFFALFGALRYESVDDDYIRHKLSFGMEQVIEGRVISNPYNNEKNTRFIVEAHGLDNGNMEVMAAPHEDIAYGDYVIIRGTVMKPPVFRESFFKKENIHGVVMHASISRISSNNGSVFLSVLFTTHNRIIETFYKILPYKKASLISGILLGERGGITDDFREALEKSGTMHLVALSGYNIGILVWAIEKLLRGILKERVRLLISIIIIMGFIVMTGAEASVVRAGIMALLIMYSGYSERILNIRNALMCAALFMVWQNPYILVFDRGFELSFLAFCGILYAEPLFKNLLKREERGAGFLVWRDHISTTLAAQIGVLPLIMHMSGYVSLLSIFSNIFILEAMPIIMGLGFMLGITGFIADSASFIVGILLNVFLEYIIRVIEFFAFYSPTLKLPLTFLGMCILYAILIGLYYRFTRHKDMTYASLL